MALEQYIQSIEDKVQLLLKKLQHIQSENVLLKEQLQTRDQDIQSQQTTIAALEDKLRLVKIAGAAQGHPASATEDEEFKKEMRSKINDYIKEIDKCMAMLNA